MEVATQTGGRVMREGEILIIELGSQHTLQIKRCLEELGHQPVIVPAHKAAQFIANVNISCVIGSGGRYSIYEKNAPRIPVVVFGDYGEKTLPYLGICYGMHAMAYRYEGEVTRGKPEYAKTSVDVADSPLFAGLSSPLEVWMSHGDSVTKVNSQLSVIARSKESMHIAAIAHPNGKHFGVQFHPEVSHTPQGKPILKNFVEGIAGCKPSVKPLGQLQSVAGRIASEVGNDRVLLLYSGGVDSTTVAAIAQPILGKKLLAITFDGGHLRKGEIQQIRQNAEHARVALRVVECSDEFVAAISKTTDPEEKRDAFRIVYGRLTREEGKRFDARVVMQGTIAPDRIESGTTGGARIKTHHNSKGLDFGSLKEVDPINNLFKDQVRALSREIGLPPEIFNRPPFPGPGNFIRVVNIPVTREALEVVQWAEDVVQKLLRTSRYHDISQLVVAVIGRAVGVKGDGPVFGYMIGVRGVRTADFMTAQGVEFESDFQSTVKKELGEHPLITQVGFFPIDKPPGTTEFE